MFGVEAGEAEAQAAVHRVGRQLEGLLPEVELGAARRVAPRDRAAPFVAMRRDGAARYARVNLVVGSGGALRCCGIR